MKKTVYILTNQAMPGIIKIGFTENSVEQRMKELDKTATPIPFECYFAKLLDKAEFVERKMHEAFDEFRIRDNREFFRMAPEQAKANSFQLNLGINNHIKKNYTDKCHPYR